MRFLIGSIRGLHPAPVARRTSEVLRDAAAAMAAKFDLRQYLSETMPMREDDRFFQTHFSEPDPITLQAQAGLSDAVQKLQHMANTASPTHVHHRGAAMQ